MTLDLSEFLSVTGKKGHFEVPIEMDRFKTKRTSNAIISKTPVIIDIANTGKKTLDLTMSFDATINFPCDRCLEDVPKEFNINVSKEIDMNESQTDRIDSLDELSYINDNELDVEKFVYNELLVNLPMKVLCSDNCKGICNRCGVNLNLQSCNCNTKELDPRMSKILDVYNNFKEV